jgi:SAM-dependent methyltransferase
MLSHIAKRGMQMLMAERPLKTNGLLMGHPAKPVHLVGLPKRQPITISRDGGDWADFDVNKWRSAMFTAQSFFNDLFADTTDFIASLCEEKGGKDAVLLVEVGCGTGEALTPLSRHAQHTVGVDFNPHFVQFCKENVPEEARDRMTHLTGDAQELDALLRRELPETWIDPSRPKVVMSVGNTMGIMPPSVRQNVYRQMVHMAGSHGYVAVVYWNGNRFGDAVQNFYHKNPQLCGPFTGDCIDLNSCTLTTPSGYCTHWTKPEEARQIFEEEIGAEVVHLVEKGNGVLIAGRIPGRSTGM